MPRTSDAKERLMEAVLELIWESSYGATSVDDICEKAGVKKGSFYHFFKSKADLEVAALESDWQQMKAGLDVMFSPTIPPLERIANFLDMAVAKQTEMKGECGCVLGCPLFTIGSEICTQESEIRSKVQAIMDRKVDYLESTIRDAHSKGLIRAPDARAKAKVLYAYFQGVMTQARIHNSLEGLNELKAGAFDILGAKVPSKETPAAQIALL